MAFESRRRGTEACLAARLASERMPLRSIVPELKSGTMIVAAWNYLRMPPKASIPSTASVALNDPHRPDSSATHARPFIHQPRM